MMEAKEKPILATGNKRNRDWQFVCDRCGEQLSYDPDETQAPIWVTYGCGCGRWVQYGAWGRRENVWEYKPNEGGSHGNG